jgi:hypothetical protein
MTILQLWLPLLVAAVGVFVASSLIHMVFKWHNSEYLHLDNEDEIRTAIRQHAPGPGQYVIPHCADMKDLQAPEMQKKFTDGPVGFLILRPTGLPRIGTNLGQWFALNLLVAIITAHLADQALPRGADPHHIFHFTALITFIAYAAGALSDGIWKGQPWRGVAKDVLDALIFGIVSGFAFAWLWPH